MILQQNYIKIGEYTQQAFKIYCRRSLASAIIQNLRRKSTKQKQKIDEDTQQITNVASFMKRAPSQDRDQSLQIDSAISDAKKTQNNLQKFQSSQRFIDNEDKFQIFYGDLVYFEYVQNNQRYRAKHFLKKIKFCSVDVIGVGSISDLRCVFEVVYPGLNYESQKKGKLVTQSSLVSFRTLPKKQYLKVKDSKIVFSDQFGKQLYLSKQLNESCVFEIKYPDSQSNEQSIISGSQIYFKLFSDQLYMNVLQDQKQIYFSQTSMYFTLSKLKKRQQDFKLSFYRMKSNKFQTSILGTPIDLEAISQRKTMTNVLAINQKIIQSKINPVTFTQYDFSKIPQQDVRVQMVQKLASDFLNCWQLIQCTNRSEPNLYYLYNPVIGLGLTIKNSKVSTVKLTNFHRDFAALKVTYHDEDILSFCSEGNFYELDVIDNRQNRQSQKFQLVLSKPQNLNQSKKIKIKAINQKTAYMICQMVEIFDVLKGAHEFLDTWGNQLDQKLQVLSYSVKQIKLGSSMMLKKIRETHMVIKILQNYLQNSEHYTHQVQNLICSMKIIHMIISICKVITTKIGYVYEEQPESPFSFAKNNLQQTLKSMLGLLMKLTKDNNANSNVIISEVVFFNKILIYYPEEIGEILQQSIKNLSVFTTKSNQNGNNQLFLWIKLIEPVRQNTIRIQKTYIDIIAEVVIDPNDRGISIYQNRCKQLLFIQNSKRKGIPKFGVDQNTKKPIIIFQNATMMSDFLQQNQHLSKLNLVHLNSASYFIQGFYSDRYTHKSDISQQYVAYIGSVIKMFRNLCRNRNKKLFKIVDDWGITQEHIQLIFASKNIGWSLKSNYLSLWMVIYIDEDPFLPFQKRQSKCHYWPKIQKYNLQDCTALIFKQYTDQSVAITKLSEYSDKIYPILSSFFHYFKKKLPGALFQLTELRCLMTVLSTIYEIINLGYMTLRAMKDYIAIILHLLSGFQQNSLAKKHAQLQIQKIHHKILIKCIEIFSLYEDIWIEIYGIDFLQNFYKQSQNKTYSVNSWEAMQQKWRNTLSNKFQQCENQIPRKYMTARKRTRFNAFSQNQNYHLGAASYECINLSNSLSYEQIDCEISQFLVTLLTKRILQHKSESHEKLITLMSKKSKRRQRICEYLGEIMILKNQKQEQIYRNFSGRQSNKLLNWLKIQEIVLKINQIQANGQSADQIQQRNKKEKVLELNNILMKINREMAKYQGQNSSMLRKCQSVLQKLNFHKILLDLLKYNQKPIYRDLNQTVLTFFLSFIYEHQQNSRSLIPHISLLSRNLNYQHLPSLIINIVKSSCNKQIIFKTTQQLIYKVTAQQVAVPLLILIQQLLSLEIDVQQNYILRNQLSRRILEQFQLGFMLGSNSNCKKVNNNNVSVAGGNGNGNQIIGSINVNNDNGTLNGGNNNNNTNNVSVKSSSLNSVSAQRNSNIIDSCQGVKQLKQVNKNSQQNNKIVKTFQFVKILCKLANQSSQMEKQIKNIYMKCNLLEKINKTDSYFEKKIYLKVLIELYIRNKSLQNFEIEDYFQVLILRQLRKLPQICMKLAQKKSVMNNSQKQSQLLNLYQDLLTYNPEKIQTKDEQSYLAYILDFQKNTNFIFASNIPKLTGSHNKNNESNRQGSREISSLYLKNQVSILLLAQILLDKWKSVPTAGSFRRKSQRMQQIFVYLSKLQTFLYLIFYQGSSVYHRCIFQQLERVNVKLQTMIYHSNTSTDRIFNNSSTQPMIDFRKQRKIDQSAKEQVIQFYRTFSKVILDQNVSAHQLFQCFNIDPKKIQMRRSNFNVVGMISEGGFMECLYKMRKYVKKQDQYRQMIESVKVFRFINISKDHKSKQIDVYFFMDKLMSLLEYTKNLQIKQQLDKENPQVVQNQEDQAQNAKSVSVPMQSPFGSSSIPSTIQTYFSIYNENQQVNERQFSMQVQAFCKASQTFKQKTVSNLQLGEKIVKAVRSLDKKLIYEWLYDSSFNVMTLGQYFNSPLLYKLINSLFSRAREIVHVDQEIEQAFTKNITEYMKVMNFRFLQTSDSSIMRLFRQILQKFSLKPQIVQKCQKIFDRCLDPIFTRLSATRKCQQTLILLQQYKNLYLQILSNSLSSQTFLLKTKKKLVTTFIKIISKNGSIDLDCSYDYEVTQAVLLMWSQSQTMTNHNISRKSNNDPNCGSKDKDKKDKIHGSLFQNKAVSQWMQKVFSNRSLRQMSGANSKNVNKSKYALLLSKLITKHYQNQSCCSSSLSSSSSSLPCSSLSSCSSISLKPSLLYKLQQTATALYTQQIQNKKQALSKQLYCQGYRSCSELHCNSGRISKNDQHIMGLILSIFVMIRVCLTNKILQPNNSQVYNNQSKKVEQNSNRYDLQRMLGQIKYKQGQTIKNYNFTLPPHHNHQCKQIQSSIITQLSMLPLQHRYSYLHVLSRLFNHQLLFLTSVGNICRLLENVFVYKSTIKKIMVFIPVMVIMMQLSSSDQQNLYKGIWRIVFLIISIVFTVISALFVIQDIKEFKFKCVQYYPYKYKKQQGKFSLTASNSTSKKKTILGQKNKMMMTISNVSQSPTIPKRTSSNIAATDPQSPHLDLNHQSNQSTQPTFTSSTPQSNPTLIKPPNQTSSLSQKCLTLPQILTRLIKSTVIFRIILLLLYVASILKFQIIVTCLLLQVIDLQQTKILFKIVMSSMKRMHYLMLIQTIHGLYAFYYYMSHTQLHQGYNFDQIQLKFIQMMYYTLYLGRSQSSYVRNQMDVIIMISYAFFTISSAVYIYYCGCQIYMKLQSQQKIKHICWICMKNKQQMNKNKYQQQIQYQKIYNQKQDQGQTVQNGIKLCKNEHSLWNYLYFFIEFDRKQTIQGIEDTIIEKINEGDYKFIKMY